ncbi:MAG: hypothetical protein RI958_1695 [Actinomycetota bacterium]
MVISLRQHIFSLVAVFVALAVGIAAGSTVVRGPLLDSTRARLESAEENIALERAENELLAAELAQLDEWAIDGPDQLISGRLPERSVLVVVAGDSDGDAVAGVLRSLRAASASVLGEIRLDPVVFDTDEVDRVRAALGEDAGGDDAAAAFGALVGQLIASSVDTMQAGRDERPDLVLRASFGELEDAGLVDLLQLSTVEAGFDAIDLVVVTDRNLVDDPARVLDGVIAVSDPDGAAVTTMVVEVGRVSQDNEVPVPSYVAAIRADGRLRDEVSTVDNAETILGWVAMVLGLEGARLDAAHYGFREGADRSLPPGAP